MTSRQRESQKRRIALGLCAMCGEKRETYKTYCDFHHKKINFHRRNRYKADPAYKEKVKARSNAYNKKRREEK